MTAATATFHNPAQSLTFASSESKAVGVGGKFMKFMQNNAASVVGALYIIAGAVLLGDESSLLKACGVMAIVGRSIMITYGNKHKQAELAAEGESAGHKVEGDGIIASLTKLTKPKSYPVEFTAGTSIVSNSMYVTYGVMEEVEKASLSEEKLKELAEAGEDPSGITAIIVGGIAALASAHMLFGKEKTKDKAEEESKKESLVFSQSESKPMGWFGSVRQKLTDNPVMATSLIFMALTVVMIAGNLYEDKPLLATVGAISLVANAIQAIFVTKKEFSVDGAKEKIQQETSTEKPDDSRLSFVQREIARRQNSNLEPGIA